MKKRGKGKITHLIAFLKPEGAKEISTPRDSARAGLGTDEEVEG